MYKNNLLPNYLLRYSSLRKPIGNINMLILASFLATSCFASYSKLDSFPSLTFDRCNQPIEAVLSPIASKQSPFLIILSMKSNQIDTTYVTKSNKFIWARPLKEIGISYVQAIPYSTWNNPIPCSHASPIVVYVDFRNVSKFILIPVLPFSRNCMWILASFLEFRVTFILCFDSLDSIFNAYNCSESDPSFLLWW